MKRVETRPAWRSRIVGSAEVAPGELVPNERNWRLHPKRQVAALEPRYVQVAIERWRAFTGQEAARVEP